MRRTCIVAAGTAVVAMLVLLFLMGMLEQRWSRAQGTLPPDLDFAAAIWVATPEGFLKLGSADGQVLLTIGETGGFRAAAIDERRGVIWASTPTALQAYAFNGQRLLDLPISAAAAVAMVVESVEGTLWLALDQTLYRLHPEEGESAIALPEPVRTLALDPTEPRVWVAMTTAVHAYDRAGQPLADLDLGPSPQLTDLAVDATSSDVWVALVGSVKRYTRDGTLVFDAPADAVRHIASDGQGGLWLASRTELLRIDASGQTLAALRPFGFLQPIVALGTDPRDETLWVSSRRELGQVSGDGQILQRVDLRPFLPPWHRVRALALYADRLPPVLAITAPPEGSFLKAAAPTLAVSYSDIGLGVHPETLRLQANGQDLTVQCSFQETAASCLPTAPLPEGPITLTAQIADYAGNVSAVAEGRFTVDLTPPAAVDPAEISIGDIVAGQVVISGAAGSVEAGATVTVTNTRTNETVVATANADGSFSAAIGGQKGDRLTLVVADAAGNESLHSTLFLNRAPVLTPVGDQVVALGTTLRLTLSATDPDGDPLSFTAAPLPLPLNASLQSLTGEFTFRPAGDAGATVMLTFMVSDGALSDAETITITVQPPPPGGVTALTGRLLDTNAFVQGQEVAVVGAVVSLLGTGVSTPSDAGGNFTLIGIPSGDQVLDIATAPANPAPDGSPYAGFREQIALIANVTNVVDRPFFLPRIAPESLTPVDPNATTVVANPTLNVSMTVAPHTAKNADGTDFTGELSISEVPAGLAPAALPEELDPGLLITIQSVGVTFATPVPITFPNTDNLPPGTETDIWSLDPASGTFIVVGTGRVSADGSVIETISGGIRAADWHAALPPKPTAGTMAEDDCQPCEASTGSETSVASGNLKVRHELVRYLSLNQPRGLQLVYTSLRADPQPILTAATTIVQRAAVPRTVSASVRVAGVDQGVAIFTDTSGLDEGRDETIRQVVQFDASGLATGVYPYRLNLTSHYARSAISGPSAGEVTVDNQRQSPVGAGWTLDPLQRLHRQPDGSALITTGDGVAQHFAAGAPGAHVVEPGWSVTRTLGFIEGQAAHYNPRDGLLYVGRRGTGAGDGLYRLNADGSATKLADGSNVAAVVVDPADGDIFFSEDFDGVIFRTAFGGTGRAAWVSGFHSGDDDPVGMAIAPANYTGTVLAPGEALVVDRGFEGPDEIWRFSPGTAQGEVRIRADDGTLINPVDITIGPQAIYLVDTGDEDGGSPPGRIYRLDAGGTLTLLLTSQPIIDPVGIATDPLTGDLFVLDAGADRLVRVNPATGAVSDMFTGMAITPDTWGGVDVTPDGSQVFITDDGAGAIYTFTRGAVLRSPPGDFSTLVNNPDGSFTRTLKDGTQIHFEAGGLQTAVADRHGNTTTYAYDGSGLLSSITDPAGLATTLTYSGGRLATLTDPAGRTTSFTHDAEGNLTRLTDPDGSSRQFTYDAHHRMIAQTSKRGFSTTYTYNFAGRHVQSTLPDGSTRQVSPSATFGLIDPSSGSGTEGNPAPVVRPGTAVAILTDGEGHVTTFQTGPLGAATRITDAAGLTTQIDRDANGNPTRVIRPSGHAVSQSYDTRGNRLMVMDETIGGTTSFTYEPTFNRLTSVKNDQGQVLSMSYDAQGNLTQVATPSGRTLNLSYDARGLPVLTTDTLGVQSIFEYDANGNLTQIISGSGTEQRIVGITRTSEGYIQHITDPMGNVILFAYDPLGQIISYTFPDNRIINFSYDANGNLMSVTPPERPPHTFAYSPVDQVIAYTPPSVDGDVTQTLYSYDAAQQLTRRIHPDGTPLEFNYDGAGRINSRTLPSGSISYTYNGVTGQLIAITAPDGGAVSYNYLGELLTDTVWSGGISGSIRAAYDSSYRLASRSVNGIYTTNFQYDPDYLLAQAGDLVITRSAQSGLVTGTQLQNIADSWNYNSFGELISYSAAYNGADVYTVHYTRDKLGLITGKMESVGGVTGTLTYSHDTAGQLTEVRDGGAIVSTYVYDSNGNRLRRVTLGGTVDGIYDAQDRMRAYGATTYTYSAGGELLSKTADGQTTTYEYDVLGNLKHVTLPDGKQIEYVVDSNNRRIGKKVNGVLTKGLLYKDRLKPAAELDDSENVLSLFVYGARRYVPDYMVKNGATYRIITDYLGSPRLVINTATGEIVQRMDYDEFGNVTFDNNPGFQPFGFTGGIYDVDTRLVRLGSRDYDPEVGRWTAKDPIQFANGDVNFYSYAGNNPVSFIDPMGLDEIEASGKDFWVKWVAKYLIKTMFWWKPAKDWKTTENGRIVTPSRFNYRPTRVSSIVEGLCKIGGRFIDAGYTILTMTDMDVVNGIFGLYRQGKYGSINQNEVRQTCVLFPELCAEEEVDTDENYDEEENEEDENGNRIWDPESQSWIERF